MDGFLVSNFWICVRQESCAEHREPQSGDGRRTTQRHQGETQPLGISVSSPEAECDMAWLLEQLDERKAHTARLEERLEESDWMLLLP